MSDYVADRTTLDPGIWLDQAVDSHNRAIEAAALATWATCPDKMLAYYDFPVTGMQAHNGAFRPLRGGATVTTWLSTILGTITDARVYRSNFGGRIVSMRVAGTNGAMYHGRASWDNGTCIVLRRSRKGRTA